MRSVSSQTAVCYLQHGEHFNHHSGLLPFLQSVPNEKTMQVTGNAWTIFWCLSTADELEKEYGKININLEDGTYEVVEEEKEEEVEEKE